MATNSHKEALSLGKSADFFKKSQAKADTKRNDTLRSQLATAFFMVKHNIAIHKFPEMMKLQEFNGAPTSTYYMHHSAVDEMITSIDSVLLKSMKEEIRDAPFVSIIVDESTDIAVFKKLIMYLQYVDHGGNVKVTFLKDADVQDGTAQTIVDAAKTVLNEMDITITKIIALGSDGAAVMTGRHNGVGVKLKRECPVFIHVHCCAHRLSLAVSQSAKEVADVSQYQTTINQVFRYYDNSAVRYNELREIQDVLLNTTVTLKEPKSVRWLSLDEAIQAIWKCWPALVGSMGQQAAAGNPVAVGLSKKVESFSFIALTALLLDILPVFSILSKAFQAETLNFPKWW